MKKLYFALTLFVLSFTANAVNIPVHNAITYFYFDQSRDVTGLENLQVDLKWIKEPDSNWGYYAQFFWHFQTETGAYTGLQQDSYSKEKKKAIFSIWDKDSVHKVRVVSSWCNRFDWEGDGAQCIIQYNWVAGRTYSFKIMKIEGGGQYVQRWGSYVVDNTTDDKTLIGVLEVPNYAGLKGFGNIRTSNIATTNEFYVGDRNAPCTGMPYLGLEWNGPFANDGKVSPGNAVIDYQNGVGAGCPNVNTVPTGPFSTRQEVGPTIRHTNSQYDNVFAGNSKLAYDQMDCLFNWIEAAFPAATGQREVRRLSKLENGNYMRDYRRGGQGFQLGVVVKTGEVFFQEGAQRGSFGGINQYIAPLGCQSPRSN